MFAPLIQATKAKSASPTRAKNAPKSPEAMSWNQAAEPARIAGRTGTAGNSPDFSAIPVVAPDRLSSFIQAKLVVGAVNHPLEREADLVADRVMRMPYRATTSQDHAGSVRRRCVGCDKEKDETEETVGGERILFHSKPVGAQPGRPYSSLESAVRSLEGAGHPLPMTVRQYMEPRFGHDFSSVRVHADGRAASLARRTNARAFTVGRNLVFATGEYAPGGSAESRRLLAHELTHVIQQGHSPQQHMSMKQQGIVGLVDVPEERSRYEQDHEHASRRFLPTLEAEGGPAEAIIQRSATWNGATVHETVNSADLSFGGDPPVTWQQLNGTSLKTVGDADGAIKAPPVTTSGSGTDWKAKVDTVPAQEGSDDETVLRPGPWTKIVTRAAAGGVTGLAACTGPGNSTFSKHGKPSDDAVYKSNRKHEDHHVADDKVAFDDAIGTWDKKVQDAKDKGTEFKGASATAATAALWAAMGNTPQNAARKYRTQSFDKGGDYHATAAGGPMVTSNPDSNADCSTSSVEVTNPA